MDSQLNFGEECVLRLEDLGEFKDYSDMVEQLNAQLEHLQKGKTNQIPHDIWEILTADPEDTFHLPSFKYFMRLTILIEWQRYTLTAGQSNQILSFYFQVVEECLLSYTFGEQALPLIMTKLSELNHQGPEFQRLLLKVLYKLSERVVFVQETQQLADLWAMMNEKLLFNSYATVEEKDQVAALLVDSAQKCTRNRKLRVILQKKSISNHYLCLKLAAWRRNSGKIAQILKQLKQLNYFGSPFLSKVADHHQEKLLSQ